VACRTLEDWWYDYRRGGFAALHPKQRADRGVPRVLSSEQEEKILASVRANLGRPVKVLYRLWKEEDPRLPGLGVIYRTLREHGLDAKTRSGLLRQGLSGPAKAFEAPLVNDLWMVDFSPGPFLPPSSGRGRMSPTHLCAIIDDHSRLIVHAQYHTAADTRAFHHTLREAILRRGVPSKLYTDQGGPFINDHTRLICANLGLRLLHAKPYHAWSKGKIERFFRSLQQDFESGLRQPDRKPRDLAELNAGLAQWLQGVYHIRHHEGIGMSPGQRFAQGAPFVRPLDPDLDLPRLKFTPQFDKILDDAGVKPVKLPANSPNLNSYAERYVLSIKSECLNHFVILGETMLRRIIENYNCHYHQERNHQGRDNELIDAANLPEDSQGKIVKFSRLGGVLIYYERQAA